MTDERCLVDLINQRFDDLNARVDALKVDMINRQDKHEMDDKERFLALTNEIAPLKNLKLTVAGACSAAFVLIQAAAEVAKRYM